MSNPITEESFKWDPNSRLATFLCFWVPVCAFLTLCSFILSPVWIEVLSFCELK
jgi:hypothetical protein